MNKRNMALSFAAVLVLCVISFSACKKKQAAKNEDGQASADNRMVQSENEAVAGDVNTVVSNNSFLHGRLNSSGSGNSIYSALGITTTDYTVDTTGAYTGTLTVNFNGTVMNNRKREGSIKLTLLDYATGKRWKDANAVLKIDYLSFKVTRASDGKFVLINGSQNLTNITGGSWLELLILKTQSSLATSITGTNLNVSFEDGKTAVYNINRKFTYTLEGTGQVLTCKGEGIGSSDGLNNLENYGTTRDGDAFTSQVSTPIIWNWTCGWWAPIQGYVEIKVDSKDFALKCTFAVDKDGNPVTVQPNTCAYGWKVEWEYNNKTYKKIFNYA